MANRTPDHLQGVVILMLMVTVLMYHLFVRTGFGSHTMVDSQTSRRSLMGP